MSDGSYATDVTPRAVILVSGGLDSATVLALAKERGYSCYTLSFDYGQRNHVELAAAAKLSQHSDVQEHRVIRFDMGVIGGSALTDRTIDVPEVPTEGIPITYVPARNTIFLSFALGYAEVVDASAIFVGVNAVDYSGYPDCRRNTLNAQAETLSLGMDYPLRIDTPLMYLTKAETWAMAQDLGGARFVSIIQEHTHTCYLGQREMRHDWGYGCGTCPACELRAKGYSEWQAAIE